MYRCSASTVVFLISSEPFSRVFYISNIKEQFSTWILRGIYELRRFPDYNLPDARSQGFPADAGNGFSTSSVRQAIALTDRFFQKVLKKSQNSRKTLKHFQKPQNPLCVSLRVSLSLSLCVSLCVIFCLTETFKNFQKLWKT